MNKLITFNCSCHKGHLYLIDEDERIVRSISNETDWSFIPMGYGVGAKRGYAYKEIENIQTLLLALTR